MTVRNINGRCKQLPIEGLKLFISRSRTIYHKFGYKPCGIHVIATTVEDNNSYNSRREADINDCEEIRVMRKDEQRAWFGRAHPDDLANAIKCLLHRKMLQAYRKWHAAISEQANEFESPSTAINKGLGVPIQIRGQSPHPPRVALPDTSNNRVYPHERRKIKILNCMYGDIKKVTSSHHKFKRIKIVKTVLPKADTNFGLKVFSFQKSINSLETKFLTFRKQTNFRGE
jgi:hypothetical protein